MNDKTFTIQELLDLEDIEENENRYFQKYGYFPFNVSTWNPTEFFSHAYLQNRIQLFPFDYIPYIYSYELDQAQICITKGNLGGNNNFGCLVTNTGTSAISLVTSVLNAIGIKRILVICPVYYASLYNLLQKGIEPVKLYIERNNYSYQLPQAKIVDMINDIDAIWLTNPIYNTGIYFSQDDIDFLQTKIPSRVMVICDDCFSSGGHEMVRNFTEYPNFISIHDPLKQIIVNGLKFACILYPKNYEPIFERWSDIICGSLSYSTVQSMLFFNSNDFTQMHSQLHQHFNEINKKLYDILECFPSISIDKQIYDSHMHMCIVPNLPYDFLQDRKQMYSFMTDTGASLIPGNRFHFPESFGFSFRINMGRESHEFWDALIRIFQYITS